MLGSFENETWLIETGADIIEHASAGAATTSLERLVYCVWVADYGMRNAGDLETASDVYADFQTEGYERAVELALSTTRDAFALPAHELERRYFELFDDICSELKAASAR